jgi:cellulose synthase/poly-beta-1,6-N-acetylglucosamine synthase-like glycosyltransferase
MAALRFLINQITPSTLQSVVNVAHWLCLGVYFVAVSVFTAYGFNTLWMALYTLLKKNRVQPMQLVMDSLPSVTVQLPLYNEPLVVSRLIDAAVRLDYPSDKLYIQVLDDSTDETMRVAQSKVQHYQKLGHQITLLHRTDRKGNKAGALQAGLEQVNTELVAVFDADFLPNPDFLMQLVGEFQNPKVGMVQARWGHLNAQSSLLTRAQAMALDGHFNVEQSVRFRLGLLLHFNGTGGIWRVATIADAGGWQADTLAEDLDLSYRAQLAGWKLVYRNDVVAPAELPLTLQGFKQQQARWAKGSIQCLAKHSRKILANQQPRHLSAWQICQALFHLGGYLPHLLLICQLLVSVPLVLLGGMTNSQVLGALGLAGLGAPLLYATGQIQLYPDGWRRFLFFPVLALLGLGLAVSNSWAIVEAILKRNATQFLRTPKHNDLSDLKSELPASEKPIVSKAAVAPTIHWSSWGELVCSGYALLGALIASQRQPNMVFFFWLLFCGFGFTALTGFQQALLSPKPSPNFVSK